jgi:hypothetical protein
MAIPNEVKLVVESTLISYVEQKIPLHIRNKLYLSYRFSGSSVILIENRPNFFKQGAWMESVVAKFRFTLKTNIWTLYCADRNAKWHKYSYAEPTEDFDLLLQAVDEDRTGIFWG